MPNMRSYRFWIGTLLAAAVWIAMLFAGEPGRALNEGLYRQFYAGGEPLLSSAAIIATELGGWIALTVATLAAAIILAIKRRRRAALLLITVSLGRLLIEVQKILFQHPRPSLSPHLTAVESMSFPSAHAGNAMITYLAIALLLPVGRGSRGAAIVLALLVALLVGISRVMLGVHWPSDVVGGWAFGLLWTLFCMRLASMRPEAEPGGTSP